MTKTDTLPSASTSETLQTSTLDKKETPKKSAKEKTHPPTSEMVNASIAALEERNGSSLQAIKKYIVATYNVDAEKMSVYIKKYLKSAIEKNIIVQTTGVGANGRFKLAASNAEKKKKKSGRKPSARKSADGDVEEMEAAIEVPTQAKSEDVASVK